MFTRCYDALVIPPILECKHYGCGFLGITGQLLIGITASYWGPRLLPSIPPSGTGTSQMGPTSDDSDMLRELICAYKQIHAYVGKIA